MAEKPKKKRQKLKQNLSVAFVLMLAAAMFSISAKLNSGESGRHPEDFAGLVRSETERNRELEAATNALQEQVDQFTDNKSAAIPELPADVATATEVGSGAVAVNGPGVRIALSDAPAGTELPTELTVDDLVVHQQDLQAVINALWQGGAEAMTLQGQRVTQLTAFRCVGNVLLLHGQVFSPPYVVEAIGDTEQLNAAIESSSAIEIYKQYVAYVGLGWQHETHTNLKLPAAANINSLKFATVPEATDIWG